MITNYLDNSKIIRSRPRKVFPENFQSNLVAATGKGMMGKYPHFQIFVIYHRLKIYNTSYLIHYLQNTLRYYKYHTTRSKISCLPRGFSKGKKRKKNVIKQNYVELYSKRKFSRKGAWWLLDRWQKFERIQ